MKVRHYSTSTPVRNISISIMVDIIIIFPRTVQQCYFIHTFNIIRHKICMRVVDYHLQIDTWVCGYGCTVELV